MSGLRQNACVVLLCTFRKGVVINGVERTKGTFYSRDGNKMEGETEEWTKHFINLAEVTWSGKLKSYAIYRMLNGDRTGEPLVQKNYD